MISVPVTSNNHDIYLELQKLDKKFQKCDDEMLRLSIIVTANRLCEKLEF